MAMYGWPYLLCILYTGPFPKDRYGLHDSDPRVVRMTL